MLVKIHKAGGKKIVSIADKELIGKDLEDGEKYLKISECFYKGEEMSGKEILNELEDANSLNIVGKDSINFCIKNKIVDKENILKIKNVPHAIVIL